MAIKNSSFSSYTIELGWIFFNTQAKQTSQQSVEKQSKCQVQFCSVKM